uniref:Polyphosphoinositide phosphatase-like n=1 Tax=Dermatophagoides pteronyssinus TaxID=6956 RepID=A0A6P6XQ29_DERPT|nr:polyphosphoinositide phosphatase-like [Dermatophagoides pteronyssinus]
MASKEKNICIEKIFCYETKNFFYVIGSSSCKNKHRILKLDRRNKLHLEIECLDNVMNTNEMMNYLREQGFDSNKRIEPTVAFGIAGFVRFLEGYYMILIIKRRCIAMIGMHCIYKIEDTLMIYVPNEEKTAADEQRYLRIFNNVDLKSNFYFSYSYDLSNSLQYNLCPQIPNAINNVRWGFGSGQTVWDVSDKSTTTTMMNGQPTDDGSIYIKPNMKFVWNEYLLTPMQTVHNDFYLYVCHGFVGQAMLPIDGRNLIITIIARRSKKYAGTRFLKRGANCDGFPANEVETEQIVHDGNISSFRYGLFSSFVQLRGSVPVYWSQNSAKMTPKPSINIDINDPLFEAAGKHFNNLLYNYGSPVIVLNLVKRKEKRAQESILFNQFESSIEYLNQFLPKLHHIMLVGYDMAKSKKQDDNVISCLTNIAQYTLRKTGFFMNRLIAASSRPSQSVVQTGIVRVNCVDCLDRTNTAQCVIGMVALGHQLYSMGVLYKPEIDPDTDMVRLLEELYEDHGDTLALQYGGSQLVHRIKTYRKGPPITSQSKDIMQSLSRYYSNAFGDWDKQTAINLFLGVYDTNRRDLPFIWNLNSDYELHHNFLGSDFNDRNAINRSIIASLTSTSMSQQRIRFTKWWSDQVALSLPRAAKELFKYTKEGMSQRDLQFVKQIDAYDWFFDVHRLQENTVFVEMFLFNMKKSKYYGHYKRKLTSYRNQNRHSLVGIPIIMRSTADESESDDESDDERDKIIIRFENDLHSISLDQVEEANHSSTRVNSGHDGHSTVIKLETNASYLSRQLQNNRISYERILCRVRQPATGHCNPSATHNNAICYMNYLQCAPKFELLLQKNSHHLVDRQTDSNGYQTADLLCQFHSNGGCHGIHDNNSMRQQYSRFCRFQC